MSISSPQNEDINPVALRMLVAQVDLMIDYMLAGPARDGADPAERSGT